MPSRSTPESGPTASSPPAPAWPLRLFALAWGLLLLLPPVGLLRVRGEWLESLSTSAVQEDWETFRREMGEQTGRDGPVQRKVPRSVEPPLRVWLRDYVGLAITAWLVLGGTLGAFLGVMVAGATAPARHHSPRTAPAVAATTRKSTNAMPSTPRSENTARPSEGMATDDSPPS